MLQIAICDDNQQQIEYTRKLVSKHLSFYNFEIELYAGAEELLQSISCGDYAPDIAMLDIVMDGMNGIDLAKHLNQLLPDCRIIYLTNYLNFAPDVYTTEHVWFVMKNNIEQSIVPALQKAVNTSYAGRTSQITLIVKSAGKTIPLPISEILYIERIGRKTRIITAKEEHLISSAPTELLSGPANEIFIHCHQGYWVNPQKILALDHNEFILTDNTRIRISRTFLMDARAKFFDLYCKS